MPFQLEDGSGLVVAESSGQIWLENDVASSGIKWPRCCCQETTGVLCNACLGASLPKGNLVLSWDSGPNGAGSMNLPYDLTFGYSRATWTDSGPISGCGTQPFLAYVQCDAQGRGVSFWIDNTNAGGICSFGWTVKGTLGSTAISSYTCNPFHLNCVSDATHNADLYNIGYNHFYIDYANPVDPLCCNVQFHVTGCSGGLDGATVTVWTNSGKTTQISTGTTDSTGNAILSVGSGNASYYVEASKTHFTTYTATVTNPIYGAPYNLTLVPASGYHCCDLCGDPLPDTLYGTHSVFGSVTYTHATSGIFGAGWYYTKSYSYPGCNCCDAKTVTVNGYLSPSSSPHFIEYWKHT